MAAVTAEAMVTLPPSTMAFHLPATKATVKFCVKKVEPYCISKISDALVARVDVYLTQKDTEKPAKEGSIGLFIV